jgi:6-phosphogluconolactonase
MDPKMRKQIWRRRTRTALAATFVAAVLPAVAGAESFVYTANRNTDNVSGFTINPATGVLAAMPGSPFPAGDAPIDVVLHPSGKFAYTANFTSGDVTAFAVHPLTGVLSPLDASPFPVGPFAQWITIDPSGTFAYVSHGLADNVSGYRINPATGGLSPVPGSPFPTGLSPFGSIVHPSGRFLYVANFSSPEISAFSIDRTTGALSPIAGAPTGRQTRQVAVDPSGRFLYAPSAETHTVHAFTINGATGTLSPVSGSPFPVGGEQPFAATVDPSGRFLYVPSEFGTVSGFSINGTTGALTHVAGSPFPAFAGPRDVTVDLTGRYAFVSHVGGVVAGYVIDSGTGGLTFTGSPISTGGAFTFGVTTGRDFTRGDFNGDGLTDVLWRRDGSGENVAWFMDGVILTAGSFLDPAALADTNWKMVGTHDFNGDRQTDILWRHELSGQNVVWYMNGASLASGTFLDPPALSDTDWKMAGTGNFDGDGKPDIVWHHRLSGQIVIWYMNGSVLTSGTFTTPSALSDTNWKLVGVSDFNEDNRPDLVWHHALSGQVVLWFMNGSVLTAGTFTTPSSFPDTNWRIAAVGDYSYDRKPDILWRHEVSGSMLVWYMDGATRIGVAAITPSDIGDPAWKVVGPR